MRIKTLLFICILGAYSVLAQAAVVKDLYSAKVIVPDQSTQAWNKAMPEAFNQVLIKVSGNPLIVNNAIVKQTVTKAKLWVKGYGYHEQWPGEQSQLWLRYDFDGKLINQLLQQAHQAKWSNDRPLTLVWLELDDDGKTTLVDSQNSLKKVIGQNAERRGIPILLPTSALEEQQHVGQKLNNPADWEWAFEHYGVKAILVGQLKQVDTKYQARWLVIANNDSKQWDASGDNNQVIAQSFDETAHWMAQESIVGNDPNAKIQKIKMQVADVQNLGDYAKISDYLTQLSFIKRVSLGGVNSQGMLFELEVVGTKAQVIKALGSSSELMPAENEHKATANTLYYRWVQGATSELPAAQNLEATQ